MIESIDFLPENYHRKRQRSRKKYWRSAVFVVFVALAGAGAVRQHLNRRKLEATRDRLQRQANRMILQLQNPEALKEQIRQLKTRSELIARLRYQTVPTRALQVVTNTLPQYVRLTRIQLEHEKTTKRIPNGVLRPLHRKQKSKSVDKPSQRIDLKQLRVADRNTRVVVAIEGVAPDDVAISQYLAALEATGALQTVQILFTDRYVERGLPLRRFGVRLHIRRIGSAGQRDASPSEVSIGLSRSLIEVRK